MKRIVLVILIFIFGFCNQTYCQHINREQSLQNTKIAWESMFPDKKCILLHKSHAEYETNVYEMMHFKSDIVMTNSRVNPYRLTVRIDAEIWSSREKRMSINDALANAEDRGDRLQGSGTAVFPLTALYQLDDGKWVLSTGNKWMMHFLKRARAKYNRHVDISKIISISENGTSQ